MDIKLSIGDERSPVELWGNVAEALDAAGFVDAALEVDRIFTKLCKFTVSLPSTVRQDAVKDCWDKEIVPLLETLGTVSLDGSRVMLHV